MLELRESVDLAEKSLGSYQTSDFGPQDFYRDFALIARIDGQIHLGAGAGRELFHEIVAACELTSW